MVSQLVLVIISAICAGVCYGIARSRGSRVAFWVVMGALFGPFAIPFVFFSKPAKGSVNA